MMKVVYTYLLSKLVAGEGKYLKTMLSMLRIEVVHFGVVLVG